jgi:NADPH:quinone reductase-like Zn-dependent oxidoreductase
MRALVAARGTEGGVALREVDEPRPNADEAVVGVHAVSLNRGECVALRTAQDGWRPGWDVAGVVVQAAADGSGPAEHARVLGWVNGGAWAERVAVGTRHVAELPGGVSFEVASTVPVAGLTAHAALHVAEPIAGRRVAVTGANGGVGRFAIQLAHADDAHTTAIVTHPDRAAGLRELGADEVEVGLDRADDPFDLILESVGGAWLGTALTRVAPDGTIVTFGNSSGEATEFDTRTFYRRGAPTLRGFFVTRELLEGRLGTPQLEDLAARLAREHLRVDIDLVTPWDEAGSAIEALLERRVAGKVVLQVR